MLRLLVAVIVAGAASTALAGQQQADQCASGLAAEPKVIYDAVAPEAAASSDLRGTITEATKSLVMSGKVARSSAKSSAEAAGQCLAMFKS